VDFTLAPEHLALRRRVRSWVEENLFLCNIPGGTVDDEAKCLARLLAKERFFAYVVPKEFGGIRARVQADS
jgi:hypothetical protein